MNIGGEKIDRGATNGLQLYGPSSDIGGPHIQAFISTDDYPVFQQLNNSHGSIAMCFDAYADGFTWKSSSSGSNAIIYKSNTDLEFSYSSGVAAGGEVTWNAGFSMDLANGLVSFSNGLDVTGDLTISGTVDGVNLPALETDVKANTAYRNTGHLPLAGGSLAGDLTWDIAIELPTWSSDTVYTPSDDPNWSISSSSNLTSTYQAFKAFNKTVLDTSDCWISASGRYNSDRTVKASTYTTTQVDGSNSYQGEWIQIRHTDKKLRLTSFILTTRLTYPEYSKYYRLLGTNDDPNDSPNWTTLMYNTTQLVWSSLGESIVLTPDGVLGYYNTYRLLITQCSVSLCSIGRFIPSFTVAEGTVIDGKSINGTDIDTLISDVKANTAKISYTDATKVGLISVTQAVNLDTMESDIATNNNKVSASGSINTHSDVNITTPTDGHVLTYTSGEWKNIPPPAVDGYLLLEGGTLTGDLNINGELAIGDGKLKGGIRLNGPVRSNDGPHITAYVSDDPYPVFEISNYAHNEATLAFDAYLVDGVWRSSSTASNCLLAKGITSIDMFFSHGIAKGEPMYKQDLLKGFTMNTETGLVICHYGLEVNGDITVSGTIDGVDSSDFLVVDGSRAMTGTLNMGNQDIDNVNQIFVDRKSVAYNKLVLYDGGTPSTTAFYGFGIQSGTLLYNVDSSNANHKFFYSGTNELFRIGDAAVYSYRNLDVKGNITVSGTVDGIDIQSLNTTVGGKLSLTGGTMGGNLDMGGYNINTVGTVDGYNLDTLNANINSKLPLSGGTVSGGTTFNSGVTFNQNITINTNKQIFWRDATAEHCGLKWLDDNHVFYCRRWANEMILDEWGRFNIRIAHNDKGWATGSGWYTSSDYNMKKNIRDISTCALDTINLLKPQCYILKDDGTENTTCGLIAQDVKKLVDEKKICFNPVNEINYDHDPDRENIMGLDYNSFIGLLIKGVQELSAEVNTLKNRIEILESPIV